MMGGILEIDVHGMNCQEAKLKVESAVDRAGSGIYRVRVIHGFNGGIRLRNMLREEFGYGRSDRVLRIEMGSNQGITELVLREY